eukprot:4214490-Pleurochrysis_carterae.AAC.1
MAASVSLIAARGLSLSSSFATCASVQAPVHSLCRDVSRVRASVRASSRARVGVLIDCKAEIGEQHNAARDRSRCARASAGEQLRPCIQAHDVKQHVSVVAVVRLRLCRGICCRTWTRAVLRDRVCPHMRARLRASVPPQKALRDSQSSSISDHELVLKRQGRQLRPSFT